MTAITFTGGMGTRTTGARSTGARTAVARSTPRLRLTRRGRVVLTTLAAAPLVAISLFLGLSGGDAAATHDVPATGLEYVSIAPGQSLWQLAEQIAPQADPREVVADILSLNRLESADIQPGQELAIPAQYSE